VPVVAAGPVRVLVRAHLTVEATPRRAGRIRAVAATVTRPALGQAGPTNHEPRRSS